MISPKHTLYLSNAISLILDGNDKSGTDTVNDEIHKGEQMLHKLRQISSYPNLLSNYLMSPSSSLTSNHRMFALLQVRKIVPLDDETVWWNLLQFYYACNQKMQNIIIDIIIKHFYMVDSPCGTFYRPFLGCVGPTRKWSMANLSKMLCLVNAVINALSIMSGKGEYCAEWKQQQIQYVAQILGEVLENLRKVWSGYIEIVTIYILKLLIIAQQCTTPNLSQHVRLFVCRTLTGIADITDPGTCTDLIRVLLSLYLHQMQQVIASDAHVSKKLCHVLESLLRSPPSRHCNWGEGLRVYAYLLLDCKRNEQFLKDASSELLKVYYDHIINVEIKKHYTQILSDDISDEQQQQIQCNAILPSQYALKYGILSQCLSIRQQFINQSLLSKSNIQMMVYLAYVNKTHPLAQIIDLITAHFNSVVAHSCLNNVVIIKCCFRYLYRFVVENPQFNLVAICISILNLRSAFAHLHQFCDRLLHRLTPILITCTQKHALWDIVQVWISNLQTNYMDVTSSSYYPILLILQSIDDYNFMQLPFNQKSKCQIQIDFPLLFQQLIQMLIEQAKSDRQKLTTQMTHPSQCDNFTIFYKMCQILVKYLTIPHKLNNQKTTIKVDNKMVKVAEKVSEHMFRNELHCPETAYIYIYNQICKNEQKEITHFIQNMTTDSFWKKFDYNQILFYSCVLFGFTVYYSTLFSFDHIYQNFMQIMFKFQYTNQFYIDINKLKYQLADFIILIDQKYSSSFN